MADRRAPLYLARASYRRRRLIDALRLVPFLLFALWLLPLLWGGDGTAQPVGAGTRAFLHVFLVWLMGVALTAWLARRLVRTEGATEALSSEEATAQATGDGPLWASYSETDGAGDGQDEPSETPPGEAR